VSDTVNQTLVHLLYIITEGLVFPSDVLLMLIYPRSYLCFLVVVRLAYSNDPGSYAGGSVATGRISHAGQVKADEPKKKGIPLSSRLRGGGT
jgi:hypothetical protein